MTTRLEAALDLWRRGLSVFPVPAPRPGVAPGSPGDGKVPAWGFRWKRYQTQRATEDEIRSWWTKTDDNIAIVTGAVSAVVAVDVDSPAALRWIRRRLPPTPWQTRTARGFHLFYQHPGRPVRNRAHLETSDGKMALDLRADGGYVVAPGSVHASGAAYGFAGDWTAERDHLPVFWVGWLQRPKRPEARRPITARPTGDVVERARRYLRALPVPEIGAGSDRDVLYAAARLARGFGLSETDARSLLWEWAGGRPGWTPEWIARKVANALAYGREAVGALR